MTDEEARVAWYTEKILLQLKEGKSGASPYMVHGDGGETFYIALFCVMDKQGLMLVEEPEKIRISGGAVLGVKCSLERDSK